MESTRKPGGLEKFQVTDREECGLVVSRVDEGIKFIYVLKIPNRATRPDDYAIFSEDMERVREVLSDDEKIIGFMHTHLAHHECEPSDRDFEGASLFPEMENLIYQPSTKRWVWYGPEVATEA